MKQTLSIDGSAARLDRVGSPWLAAGVWAAGWVAMLALDGHVDLANLAMVLVLASALASLWLRASVAVLAGAAAVLAFNFAFVPPRGQFTVDLHQHALLLLAMLLVNWIVAALMVALRQQARHAGEQAARAEQLRRLGETLRDAVDPLAHVSALGEAIQAAAHRPAALLVLKERSAVNAGLSPVDPSQADPDVLRYGRVDADQQAGLWHCQRQGRAMGPGTGHFEDQPDWYLPLRGRGVTLGAAVLRGDDVDAPVDTDLQAHLQALCDQMGLALQRALAEREERDAQQLAQTQAVRNALLAAISHDYRTPLATIMSAASSLEDQADRLAPEQRQRLAHSIVDEVTRLSRLTDNTLQLARLDAPGVTLRCDWESAEEIVGAALRHARQRDPARRVRARLEPGLPLLWCDAILIAQLLDNLIDNALKYSPAEAPVEILVQRRGEHVVLAVRDRGPGIAPAWRSRVFDVFHRGAEPMDGAAARSPDAAGGDAAGGDAHPARARPGAGVGLAVCRAIARAHGGELRLRARGHGGCSFECELPLRKPPAEEPPP